MEQPEGAAAVILAAEIKLNKNLFTAKVICVFYLGLGDLGVHRVFGFEDFLDLLLRTADKQKETSGNESSITT